MAENFYQKRKSSDGIRVRETLPAPNRTASADEEFLYAPPERISAPAQEYQEDEEEKIIISGSTRERPKENGRGRRRAVWGMAVGCAAVAAAALAASTAGARLTLTLKPRIESVSVEDIAVHFDTAAVKVSAVDK